MNTTLASLLFLTATLVPAVLVQPATLQDPTPMPARQKITPCLWFTDNAEEALRFYLATFKNAKVVNESRWGEGGPMKKGALMAAHFQIDGQEIMVLNSNPARNFTEAVSLCVSCDTQAEIDHLWKQLISGGGEPSRCGWLKDRFGVSWQIIPSMLGELMNAKDPARAQRVGAVLMQMDKLDIERLKKAADGR